MSEHTNKCKAQAATSARGKPRIGRTKRDQLIRILSAPRGAAAETISRKFCWQPHTTRAALSRLRKAGFDVRTERPGDGKPTRYRIVAARKSGVSPDAK